MMVLEQKTIPIVQKMKRNYIPVKPELLHKNLKTHIYKVEQIQMQACQIC
ncbi:hypothetical protein IYQ_15228 [Aeromonas salmonicida subsp. salmonicida 01-B526]|uniref:Uncharacterized protein n=1 Tax=Aeromonas salmonicida subsp. salmonicida 01-B526 TaxID=1076135 RepID=A0ABN0DXI6_AERSS|nr:hypothetical protein IYQ_15228 [Aeromonas salmonicida subsp. salmonicida 01-B526]